jgi:hypothetical protein
MSAAAGPELRDIHLPPAPSWWPPAPGWWLLALLLCFGAFIAVRWLLQRERERRWRRRVHAELDRIAATHAAQPDAVLLAGEVSQLLRRMSLLIDPHAAALRDDAWLDFLDRQLSPEQALAAPFRSGSGRLLIDAPFRRVDDAALHALDAPALIGLARNWLSQALRARRSHA